MFAGNEITVFVIKHLSKYKNNASLKLYIRNVYNVHFPNDKKCWTTIMRLATVWYDSMWTGCIAKEVCEVTFCK